MNPLREEPPPLPGPPIVTGVVPVDDFGPKFRAFVSSGEAITQQAWACYRRAVTDPRLRRIRFGALGLASPEIGEASVLRAMQWPGGTCFPGAARVELPAANGIAQEIPIDHLATGAIALALPVLDWMPLSQWISAGDIVWTDPVNPANWARAHGLAEFLGFDPRRRLDPQGPVRLHRDPLSWFRAAAASPLGWAFDGVCLLDPASRGAEDLLLGPPLICDDDSHAAAVNALQKDLRSAMLKRLPKPGALLVAGARVQGAAA